MACPEGRASARFAVKGEVALVDRWIFSRLARATAQVNDALEHFRFHEAAHVVYHFFWGDFCDWYIEWVKPELNSADREKAQATWKNLFAAFESALRLLHPFMPFLTEEVWHQLPQRSGARSIALERFPEPHVERMDSVAEEQISLLQEIITAARNIRAEMKLDMKANLPAQLAPGSDAVKFSVERSFDTVLRLANLSSLTFAKPPFDSTKGVIRSTKDFDLFISYNASFDNKGEVAPLRKALERLTTEFASKRQPLQDEKVRTLPTERIRQARVT